VKHRSPLITLAAVVLAFAIMFIVDILSGPPGSTSAETANPSAAPPTAGATSTSPQPTETTVASTSPSASKSAEDSKFPEKIVYAGNAEDGAGAIAVALGRSWSAACPSSDRRQDSPVAWRRPCSSVRCRSL